LGRGHTIPDDVRAFYERVAVLAQQLRDKGQSLVEVCQELNRLGYRTRTGKTWNHRQQVLRLIQEFGDEGPT
jgi:hypothetical protein